MQLFASGISIHFLYTEEDAQEVERYIRKGISIHFLYTEDDLRIGTPTCMSLDFNPLPLYRGRPEVIIDAG